jgi:hypothetical protein
VLPALRVTNGVVALFVPVVPLVFARGLKNLILGVISTLDLDELALLHLRAALRGRDINLALVDHDLSFRRRDHLNAVNTLAVRMYCHVGRVYLNICLASFEHSVSHETLRHLNLNMRLRKISDFGFRVFAQTQHIGVVKLYFRPGPRSRSDPIPPADRSINRARDPLSRIPALRRHIAVHHAYPRDGRLGLLLLWRLLFGRLIRRLLCFNIIYSKQTESCNYQN